MKNKILVIILIALTCIAIFMIFRYKKISGKDENYMMGPPWLLYSDERLIDEFSEAALNGESDRVVVGSIEMSRISANQILYEVLYLSNGDYSKAKPYLEKAASLGDPMAIEILKDPTGYHREFRRRNPGEPFPEDFELK